MEVLRDIEFVSKGLRKILDRFGEDLIENPERLNLFWMDVMPTYHAERKLVIKAVELRIAREIFAAKDKKRDEQVNTLKFYRKKLKDELFLTEEAVDYILDVLATAAGMGSLSKALAAEQLAKKLREASNQKAAQQTTVKTTQASTPAKVATTTTPKKEPAKTAATTTPKKEPVKTTTATTTTTTPKKEPAKPTIAATTTTPKKEPAKPATTTTTPKKEPVKTTPTPTPAKTTTTAKPTTAKKKKTLWEVKFVSRFTIVWALALFVWYVAGEGYRMEGGIIFGIMGVISILSLLGVRKGSIGAAIIGFFMIGLIPMSMAIEFYAYIFDWYLDYGAVCAFWLILCIVMVILARRIENKS